MKINSSVVGILSTLLLSALVHASDINPNVQLNDLDPSLFEKKWCPGKLTNEHIESLLKNAQKSFGFFVSLDSNASFMWRDVKFSLKENPQALVNIANKVGSTWLGITGIYVMGLQHPIGRGASIKCTYALEHGRSQYGIESLRSVDQIITIEHQLDYGNAVPEITEQEFLKAQSEIVIGAERYLDQSNIKLNNLNVDDYVLKIIQGAAGKIALENKESKDGPLLKFPTTTERRVELDRLKRIYESAYEKISLYYLYHGNIMALKKQAEALEQARQAKEEEAKKIAAVKEQAAREIAAVKEHAAREIAAAKEEAAEKRQDLVRPAASLLFEAQLRNKSSTSDHK